MSEQTCVSDGCGRPAKRERWRFHCRIFGNGAFVGDHYVWFSEDVPTLGMYVTTVDRFWGNG